MPEMFARLLERFSGHFGRSKAPRDEPHVPGESSVWSMPTGAQGAWIAHAKMVRPTACDASFMLEPNFYIGPGNDFTSQQWETARIDLPVIDLPRQFTDRVTTAEALDREDTLIDYYRRIVEIATEYRKTDKLRPFPYFRTRPLLVADGEVLTEFSWNDSIDETSTILQHFADGGQGPPRLLHFDVDQGWKVQIATTGTVTYLMEWGDERYPPTLGGYACDSRELAHQATSALERLHCVHSRLAEAIGFDYWS